MTIETHPQPLATSMPSRALARVMYRAAGSANPLSIPAVLARELDPLNKGFIVMLGRIYYRVEG